MPAQEFCASDLGALVSGAKRKPAAARRQADDVTDGEVAIVCYQKCDFDRLAHINYLESAPQVEAQIQQLYQDVFYSCSSKCGQESKARC